MIPKRLIFTWLGGDVPEYGKFCMDNFARVNPEFEIMFVHEPNIDSPLSKDLDECLKLTKSDEYTIYRHMVERKWAKKNLLTTDVGKMTALSDALRMYLLNKYGGIYLDLDTFPVRPFDDTLLSHKGFVVSTYTESRLRHRFDIFFMGFERGYLDESVDLSEYPMNNRIFGKDMVYRVWYPTTLVYASKSVKQTVVKKFMNGTLQYGEKLTRGDFMKDYYIDHFGIKSWGNGYQSR